MNFQNLPRDSTVKQAFIPKLDALVFVDYSAIEMRMLATYTARIGNWDLVNEFKAGLDPHYETAKLMFGDNPTKQHRQICKRINFLIVYGGGADKLVATLKSDGIKVTKEEAAAFIRKFHKARPECKILSKMVQERVEARGYVYNLYGRRYADTVNKNYAVLNYLLQGSAADMMQYALVRVHNALTELKMQSHIINMVHDEIVLDCAKDEVDRAVSITQKLMKCPKVEKYCPIDTEVEISYTNWAEKEPYENV